jgi:hypothetical protein
LFGAAGVEGVLLAKINDRQEQVEGVDDRG